MRRAATVIAATAGGLALVAGFHTTPDKTLAVTGTSTADPKTEPSNTTPTTAPVPISGAPTTTRPPGSTTTTAPSASRTVDGPVVGTDYGDVQVRITLTGTTITDVQALQLPNDRSRSRRISQAAGPLLRTEALQAQSARIDAVSGASYTSEGYAESLQGALDKAGR